MSSKGHKKEPEGSPREEGILVYEVDEVYIYIPAELSAAGFELKIGGSVRITDKVERGMLDCGTNIEGWALWVIKLVVYGCCREMSST